MMIDCTLVLWKSIFIIIDMFNNRQGGKAGAMQPCSACRGRGIKITMRSLGPGMVQQMQTVCPDCHGEGMSHFL